MADATFPLAGQGVYRKQGGKELVVGSSGTLTIEAGGTLSITTGATVSLSSGTPLTASGSTGIIVIDSGGQIAVPVTVTTSSAGTVTNFGVFAFGSTSANAYTLTAPDRPGLRKTIINTVSGASTVTSTLTTATTNSYIRNSSGVAADTHTLTYTEAGDWTELISVTTSEWRVLGNSGGVLS